MPFDRCSGILLHPTSLPSRFGIGDLGEAAYTFVDFLKDSGQTLWQVLPLGPTGYGNSPYMSFSAIAGNPLLIDPLPLLEDGLLDPGQLAPPDFPSDRVEFDRVIPFKMAALRAAYSRFQRQENADFEEFCQAQAGWLEDYALFMALRDLDPSLTWNQWDEAIARRQPAALRAKTQALQEGMGFHKFLQYEFFRQWTKLRAYANAAGIQIIGDIPIYVAPNSADVWAHPEVFDLDPETGSPAQMAGVPPDYFSETGQLWGNPVYNWEYLEETGFAWWIDRFRFMLQYVDLIRIDHFRGFESFWQVPAGETTAIHGEWVKAPGAKLFDTLRETLGSLPILAEDLGIITPEVEALRDRFEFPGMRVLLFAFGGGADNIHLPHHHARNSIVYTGTHDNDTTLGWWQRIEDWERKFFKRYLGYLPAEEDVAWTTIRMAFASVANMAIVPLQDVLGLDNSARMNRPGTATGNWEWRYASSDLLNDDLRDRLLDLTELYSRDRKPLPVTEGEGDDDRGVTS